MHDMRARRVCIHIIASACLYSRIDMRFSSLLSRSAGALIQSLFFTLVRQMCAAIYSYIYRFCEYTKIVHTNKKASAIPPPPFRQPRGGGVHGTGGGQTHNSCHVIYEIGPSEIIIVHHTTRHASSSCVYSKT